jgi:hypothetical protein
MRVLYEASCDKISSSHLKLSRSPAGIAAGSPHFVEPILLLPLPLAESSTTARRKDTVSKKRTQVR